MTPSAGRTCRQPTSASTPTPADVSEPAPRGTRRGGGDVAGAAVSLLLFAGAVYVLHAELRDHPVHEIVAELRASHRSGCCWPSRRPSWATSALAGYDAVSLATLGRRLPFRRVAYAAFLGYAFANSLPLSVVTGAAVRYRLYSQWGIARGERRGSSRSTR